MWEPLPPRPFLPVPTLIYSSRSLLPSLHHSLSPFLFFRWGSNYLICVPLHSLWLRSRSRQTLPWHPFIFKFYYSTTTTASLYIIRFRYKINIVCGFVFKKLPGRPCLIPDWVGRPFQHAGPMSSRIFSAWPRLRTWYIMARCDHLASIKHTDCGPSNEAQLRPGCEVRNGPPIAGLEHREMALSPDWGAIFQDGGPRRDEFLRALYFTCGCVPR